MLFICGSYKFDLCFISKYVVSNLFTMNEKQRQQMKTTNIGYPSQIKNFSLFNEKLKDVMETKIGRKLFIMKRM